MKRLGTRVNLIPVVTKADTLTQNDLFTFKQHESADHTRILTDGTSFSIIGPTEDVKALDGRVVGGCEYRCDQQPGQLTIFGRLPAADHFETLLYPTTMGIKGLWKVFMCPPDIPPYSTSITLGARACRAEDIPV